MADLGYWLCRSIAYGRYITPAPEKPHMWEHVCGFTRDIEVANRFINTGTIPGEYHG